MATTINPYGRQIFLTRKEIHNIKSMIEIELAYVEEEIKRLETQITENGMTPRGMFEAKEDLAHRQAQKEELTKLDKKLYYYVPKALG